MADNSPTFQRWDLDRRWVQVPKGRLTVRMVSRPVGTYFPCTLHRNVRFTYLKRALFTLFLVGALANTQAEEVKLRSLPLKEAAEIALKKHPRISAADLKALAARQVIREVRSAFFPTLSANATAVGTAGDNTRIAAGGLNNPSIFERNAEGVTLSQLITDFGRTGNLAASSKSRAQAEEKNAEATREQILLLVNSAYFSALEAQSVLGVARQTVNTRQALLDQVQELAKNKLKSDLDVSFASVNLEEGKLLLAQAQNDLRAAFTSLSVLLSYPEEQDFELIDEALPAPLKTPTAQLVGDALKQRPELARLRFEVEASLEFAKAEKKLLYPTISAIGSAGVVPFHDSHLPDNYAAAGVNFNLPLFTGGLYAARRREAALRAQAAQETLRDEENNVIREVRLARLNVDYTFERLDLTAKLLAHANQAFDLIQTRYNLGASSIVELSQAQLNKTTAEIAQANAKYGYHLQRAILDFQIGTLR